MQVLDARKRILGKEHPNTLISMANLAFALIDIEKREETKALHRTALEIRLKILGEEHPDTLISLEFENSFRK
jgi:hypothetical protein